MRTSQFFIGTLRESPAEAEIISHQLMLRAGLIKRLSSGLYSWLPLGLRILRKVEAIVREEMQQAGALELLMPMVQPAELWQESKRIDDYGRELLKLRDRHDKPFCLGPTHEEVVTDIARQQLHSYKQLPLNFFQIQTKFRDEIRPRFGVMRAREFIMKDAYSFHIDPTSLAKTYQAMYDAYTRIFTRLGLEFRSVLADTGSIGGSQSHEFHVIANTGEDALAISDTGDYAANVELAEANAFGQTRPEPHQPAIEVATPNVESIHQLCSFLNIQANKTVKCLIVEGIGNEDVEDKDTKQSKNSDDAIAAPDLVAIIIRGDHTLNEIKAEKHPLVRTPLVLADNALIQSKLGCDTGSLGPCSLTAKNIPVLVDHSAAMLGDFTCGANKNGYHLQNVNWERDAQFTEVADLRQVVPGDPSPDGRGQLIIKRGIEVGHIFQLGTKYSQAMKATVLDDSGKPCHLSMGCYGIGISRIVAAAIEQNHDAAGLLWPSSMAPFQVGIVGINMDKSAKVTEYCERLLQTFEQQGIETLLDDRRERPGVKFADMELIGIPHRIVVSEKTLKDDQVEYTARLPASAEYALNKQKQLILFDEITDFIQKNLSCYCDAK